MAIKSAVEKRLSCLSHRDDYLHWQEAANFKLSYFTWFYPVQLFA